MWFAWLEKDDWKPVFEDWPIERLQNKNKKEKNDQGRRDVINKSRTTFLTRFSITDLGILAGGRMW